MGNLTLIFRLVRTSLLMLLLSYVPGSLAQDASTENVFRLGYFAKDFSEHKIEDLEIAIKVMAEEIGKQIGINIVVTVYPNATELRKGFQNGEINCILASSLLLAQEFDNNSFAEGFKLMKSKDAFDRLVVVTRKAQSMDDFSQLQGKRLTMLESIPITDYFMDVQSYKYFSKPYRSVFKRQEPEKKSSLAILKLFFNQTDVICIYENNFMLATDLNPQLNNKLQVIAKLDNVPQAIGFFSTSTPVEFRQHVIAEVVKLNNLVRGEELWQMLKVDRAEAANADDLVETRKLVAEYQILKKGK